MENGNSKMWTWARNIAWVVGLSVCAYGFIVNPIFEIKTDIVIIKKDIATLNKWLEDNKEFTDERVKCVDEKLADYGERISFIEYLTNIK